tara:strand:- start:7365 stop:7913 length:549 start_codon:yes stop_codon:yes gene_type:complete
VDFYRAFFGLILSFLIASCTNDTQDVEQVSATPMLYPLNEQHHARIVYSDSGINVLEIAAGIIQDFGNIDPPYVFFGRRLEVRFYNGEAISSTVLTADTARQQKKEDLWAIGGNVIVTNGKGEQMETELLYWDKANERIHSESAVQIKTDGQLIIGKGFEADQEFNNYRIFKVQGQITIDDE